MFAPINSTQLVTLRILSPVIHKQLLAGKMLKGLTKDRESKQTQG